jgi:predicted GNAT family acetyltransferase
VATNDDAAGEARVVDNPDGRAYEAYVGDELAGLITYRLDADRIVFVHTEVRPAFQDQGVAAQLAKAALDDARARGLSVVAQCPYVAGYIEKHPEYASLLAT